MFLQLSIYLLNSDVRRCILLLNLLERDHRVTLYLHQLIPLFLFGSVLRFFSGNVVQSRLELIEDASSLRFVSIFIASLQIIWLWLDHMSVLPTDMIAIALHKLLAFVVRKRPALCYACKWYFVVEVGSGLHRTAHKIIIFHTAASKQNYKSCTTHHLLHFHTPPLILHLDVPPPLQLRPLPHPHRLQRPSRPDWTAWTVIGLLVLVDEGMALHVLGSHLLHICQLHYHAEQSGRVEPAQCIIEVDLHAILVEFLTCPDRKWLYFFSISSARVNCAVLLGLGRLDHPEMSSIAVFFEVESLIVNGGQILRGLPQGERASTGKSLFNVLSFLQEGLFELGWQRTRLAQNPIKRSETALGTLLLKEDALLTGNNAMQLLDLSQSPRALLPFLVGSVRQASQIGILLDLMTPPASGSVERLTGKL